AGQRRRPCLGSLRLVGGVARVPARVLEGVWLNHRRNHAIRVSHTDEGTKDLISRRESTEISENLELGQPLWQTQTLTQTNLSRNGRVDQRIERREAKSLEHLGHVSLVGSYMSGNEGFSGRNSTLNVLDCGTHRSD